LILEKAGQGMFSIASIVEGSIISYIGTIASNFTSNMTHNSLYHLGWISSEDKSRELLISTESIGNAARFINSSDYNNRPNCKPVIGFLSNHEITVVLVVLIYLVDKWQ
jgi:hypothetical protein